MKFYRIEESYKVINGYTTPTYKAHSLFNSWSSGSTLSKDQARIDGEEHQKILLTIYPNLIKLTDDYR